MSNRSPLVAVVIPLYNKQDTVERAIMSALKQTIGNIEVVVVNDGSTDNSLMVADQACSTDSRAKVVSIPNGGVAVARTTGVLQHTTAPYVLCLDADDAIQPQFLELLVPHLHADRGLGIVYTTLVTVLQNGKQSVSKWPSTFVPEQQFFGINQVPTAALTRREVWERLGGQRSRYAPLGAGSEDADFWLRACAYGFGAKFVAGTTDSAFMYTAFGGTVSGNREYSEVNWKAWHPWTRDRTLMPMFSIAPPEKMSHPGRQYDEPGVSVIIPVGPGHLRQLANALDSLDAQTYRKLEGVVVFDVGKEEWESEREHLKLVLDAWPHMRYATTAWSGNPRTLDDEYDAILSLSPAPLHPVDFLEPPESPKGAGVARNVGIALSRGARLLFLDADDWITPDAVAKMRKAQLETGDVIYSDHVMVATVEYEDLNLIKGKLQNYDHRNRIAYIWQDVAEYDCERAMRQPEKGKPPYVICNVTCMMPRSWALAVGGFDENMPSWEDVLFFLKLAWSGHCFTKVGEPLLAYRYHTGSRREIGFERRGELMDMLRSASREWGEKVACGCIGGTTSMSVAQGAQVASAQQGDSVSVSKVKAYPSGYIDIRDEDMVLADFHPHRVGDMPRYGLTDFGGGRRIWYGYQSSGSRFYVHQSDIDADRSLAKKRGVEPQFSPVFLPGEADDGIEPDVASHELAAAELLPDDDEAFAVLVDAGDMGHSDGLGSTELSAEDVPLSDFEYGPFGGKYLAALSAAGINTVGELRAYESAHEDGILGISGIGERSRAMILAATATYDD